MRAEENELFELLDYYQVHYSYFTYDTGGGGSSPLFRTMEEAYAYAFDIKDRDTEVYIVQAVLIQEGRYEDFKELKNLLRFDDPKDRTLAISKYGEELTEKVTAYLKSFISY